MGDARRRRESQLRVFHRHEAMSVRLALAVALHDSAGRRGHVTEVPQEEVEGEQDDVPRHQKPPPPGTLRRPGHSWLWSKRLARASVVCLLLRCQPWAATSQSFVRWLRVLCLVVASAFLGCWILAVYFWIVISVSCALLGSTVDTSSVASLRGAWSDFLHEGGP